ncbi:hypothetical protein [Actinomyces faecalis]|uniref:hypothetical protein n=1 Tax=Actinomyces faecalis TaxID=2722820 RepID=UPI001F1A7432|nr:hypothetical protein [Actinomyces faecalis]
MSATTTSLLRTPSGREDGPGQENQPDQDETDGLYGPRGWSVRAGVWDVLARARDEMRSTTVPGRFGLAPQGGIRGGRPVDDYTPFHDMGPSEARRLLEILPADQLEDRQNLGPTLGSLLHACAGASGRVRLSGYGIGPQRTDERVTVEALWVADPDLMDLEVYEDHDDGCCCTQVWRQVEERYGLDAQAAPDEIKVVRRLWTSGEPGTWMWWD